MNYVIRVVLGDGRVTYYNWTGGMMRTFEDNKRMAGVRFLTRTLAQERVDNLNSRPSWIQKGWRASVEPVWDEGFVDGGGI